MPDGRGSRIALEAGFLVVVAAVLGVADVRPFAIVVVMLVAWAIVALLEWVAWRDEAHWSAGLPPRYYVPQQPLPPRPPSEELPAFSMYPRPPLEAAPRLTEAPTWIATPEMREELFGWPTPQPAVEEPAPEDPAPAPSLGRTDPWPAPLPVEPAPVAAEHVPVEDLRDELLDAASAAGASEPDVEPAGWPPEDEIEPALDPWFVEAPPVEPVFDEEPEPESAVGPTAGPEAEPDQVEPELEAPELVADPDPEPAPVEAEPEPVVAAEPVAEPAPVVEPEPELVVAAEPDPAPELDPGPLPEPELEVPRLARHRIDPFSAEPGRRWWRRRGEDAVAVAELPPLPRHQPVGRVDGDGR